MNLQTEFEGAVRESRARHEELTMMLGAILASVSRARGGGVPAHVTPERSDEVTDRFRILDGVNLELSRRRQRKLLVGIGVACLWIASHVAQWLLAQ